MAKDDTDEMILQQFRDKKITEGAARNRLKQFGYEPDEIDAMLTEPARKAA